MRSAVIIEPEIPENTGFIARMCSNFGFELRLVNPKFNLKESKKTASNAQDKLRNAKIFDTAQEAIEDLNFVVGTKPGKGSQMEEFQAREDTSLMIGRESSGLSNDELELCDAIVHIKTGEYNSINQSHAAGIIMHSFSVGAKESSDKSGDYEVLERFVQIPLLRKLLKQANPSEDELNSLIGQMKDHKYFN